MKRLNVTIAILLGLCMAWAWSVSAGDKDKDSDNEKVGSQLPRHYLADYQEAGRRQFRRVMRSHLIPVGDDSGVWERGVVGAFKQFRQRRLAILCSEFEKAAGIKLFRRV